QFFYQTIAMIALDFDSSVLHAAAAAATLLQIGGQCGQFAGGQAQAGDDGDALALATLGFTAHTDGACAGGGLAGRAFLADAFTHGALTVGAALTNAGGVDETAIGGAGASGGG